MKRAMRVVAVVLWVASAAARADDAVDDVLTPAERAVVRVAERTADAFVKSSDLRLRIVYSLGGEVESDARPEDRGVYAAERITTATLYADARGSTDPLVLDLLLWRCGIATKTQKACDRVDLATRWTTVDAQNQLAWLTLATVRAEAGEETGARAAFLRAADAPRWHSHAFDLARVVARAEPTTLPPEMRNAYLVDALGRGYAVLPFGALQTLGRYCKEEGEARRACARIVAVLARDGETLMELSLVVPYAVRAQFDPVVVAGYREESDALRWALQSEDKPLDVVNETEPAAQRRDADALRALIAAGERGRAEAILRARGVSKPVAAARFAATLSPEALKQREMR